MREREMKNKKQKKERMVSEMKKGDLYYTSWGYDQTNYDYIMVLGVSKSGKTVKAQKAKSQYLGSEYQTNKQLPLQETFGDIFQMKVKEGYSGDIVLRGSYPFCNDGSMEHKRLDTFYKVAEGQTFNETMSEFGH
jgi:hypothetical protein